MNKTDLLHVFYVNIGNLAVVCLLLNVILSLWGYKRFSTPFRRLCYFLIWNLLIEISARTFTYMGHNNLPLLHLYTLGEFVLLSWFYKSLMSKPRIFQDKFGLFLAIGGILIIGNSFFFQSIFGFNAIAKTAVQITIISYAVLYFYHLTETQPFSRDIEKSLRLINSAIIVYYSGSLFIFMCSQISFDNSELYEFFWAFNAVLNLIFQLLILWGIWRVTFLKTPLSS